MIEERNQYNTEIMKALLNRGVITTGIFVLAMIGAIKPLEIGL